MFSLPNRSSLSALALADALFGPADPPTDDEQASPYPSRVKRTPRAAQDDDEGPELARVAVVGAHRPWTVVVPKRLTQRRRPIRAAADRPEPTAVPILSHATIIGMLAACGTGMYLYAEKHHAAELDNAITHTYAAIEQAHERTGMLHAEWAQLNEPDRLRSMVDRYLVLQRTGPEQFADVADLHRRLPDPHVAARAPEVEDGVAETITELKPMAAMALAEAPVSEAGQLTTAPSALAQAAAPAPLQATQPSSPAAVQTAQVGTVAIPPAPAAPAVQAVQPPPVLTTQPDAQPEPSRLAALDDTPAKPPAAVHAASAGPGAPARMAVAPAADTVRIIARDRRSWPSRFAELAGLSWRPSASMSAGRDRLPSQDQSGHIFAAASARPAHALLPPLPAAHTAPRLYAQADQRQAPPHAPVLLRPMLVQELMMPHDPRPAVQKPHVTYAMATPQGWHHAGATRSEPPHDLSAPQPGDAARRADHLETDADERAPGVTIDQPRRVVQNDYVPPTYRPRYAPQYRPAYAPAYAGYGYNGYPPPSWNYNGGPYFYGQPRYPAYQ